MPTVRLSREIDFEGWRTAARTLRAADVRPEEVAWCVGADLCGMEEGAPQWRAAAADDGAFAVPRDFVALAEAVVCHRHQSRFSLLYRLLFRLRDQPELLDVFADPDVSEAQCMARQVDRAGHRLKAFVRFCEIATEAGVAHVAWFEPPHRVLERTAPFFVRRFAGARFSILTPDACAHWDGENLAFTPGADGALDFEDLTAAYRRATV